MGKGMHIMMTPKLSMGIPDSANAEDEDNANEMDVEDWGLPDEMKVKDARKASMREQVKLYTRDMRHFPLQLLWFLRKISSDIILFP